MSGAIDESVYARTVKTTIPLLGLFLALALSGCGKKSACLTARAKTAADLRAQKALHAPRPAMAPVASPPVVPPAAPTGNAETDLVHQGAAELTTISAELARVMAEEAQQAVRREASLPDQLETLATGIESPEARVAKTGLKALLAEVRNAKANRAKRFAALKSQCDALVVRIEPSVHDDKLSQATKDALVKQQAAANRLIEQISAEDHDIKYDVVLGGELPVDLETVQKACAKS